MSRRRNKKRRKDRKQRAEARTEQVRAEMRAVRGRANREFFGKARKGDAAALSLEFGPLPLAYDEDGNLQL